MTFRANAINLEAPISIEDGGTNSISTLNNDRLIISSSGSIVESSVFSVSGNTLGTVSGKMDLDASSQITLNSAQTSTFGGIQIGGTDSSATLGANMIFYTDGDTHPLGEIVHWSHDDVGILFDAYRDSSDYRSGDTGSNAFIHKNSDKLAFKYDGGIIAGNAITWNTAMDIDLTNGDITIDNSASTTNLVISNSASDGDPQLGFALSGASQFTLGVDDGDGDKFKIGTTAIGTDTRMSINSSGNTEFFGQLKSTIGGNSIEMTTPSTYTGIVFNSEEANNYSRFDINNVSNATESSRYFNLKYEDDSYGIVIEKGGGIGIGTTTPAELLEIASGSSTTTLQISNSFLDGDPQLAFALSGTKTFTMGIDNSDSDKFKIGTTAVNTGTKVTIDSSGNMGVGTTAPAELFEIKNDSPTTTLQISNGAADGDPQLAFALGSTKIFTLGVDDGDNNKLKIGTTSIGVNTRMTIDSSGNVGIGTSNPAGIFEIEHSTKPYTQYTSGSNEFDVGMHSTGNAFIWNDADGYIHFGTNNTERMRIDADGNVGISETSPDYPLHVEGSESVSLGTYGYLRSNASTPAGYFIGPTSRKVSIYGSDNIVAGSEFHALSDGRIKDVLNKSDTQEDLKIINALEPIEYQYIDKVVKGGQIIRGFIAQEVEKVYPTAVSKIKDFTPNIFVLTKKVFYDSENKEVRLILEKEHDFLVDDIVKIITSEGENKLSVKEIISEYEFVLGACEKDPGDEILVFGKEVDDFRTLNYDSIFTVGIGAIQELSKKMDEVFKILKKIKKV